LTLHPYELDLCVADINRTLGLSLAERKAWFSTMVHEKTAKKHAADYRLVMKHLDECCRAPTYVGLHGKHPDKVELILDVAMTDETVHVLVAVVIQLGRHGKYNVASAYCINDDEVAQRIRRNSVHKIRSAGKAEGPERQSAEPSESPTEMQSSISWGLSALIALRFRLARGAAVPTCMDV
jgi:hypothetical protein